MGEGVATCRGSAELGGNEVAGEGLGTSGFVSMTISGGGAGAGSAVDSSLTSETVARDISSLEGSAARGSEAVVVEGGHTSASVVEGLGSSHEGASPVVGSSHPFCSGSGR